MSITALDSALFHSYILTYHPQNQLLVHTLCKLYNNYYIKRLTAKKTRQTSVSLILFDVLEKMQINSDTVLVQWRYSAMSQPSCYLFPSIVSESL